MENQPTAPIPGTQYTPASPIQGGQTPAQSSPQPSKPNAKKWLWAVVGALLVALVLFFTPIPYYQNDTICTLSLPGDCISAGWKLGPSLFTRILGQYSTSTDSTTQQLRTKDLAIDTTNWKQYINPRYKYSVKYPGSWHIKSMNDDSLLTDNYIAFGQYFTSPDLIQAEANKVKYIITVQFIDNNKQLSADQWWKNEILDKKIDKANTKNVTVTKISGVQGLDRGDTGYKILSTVFPSNTYLVNITLSYIFKNPTEGKKAYPESESIYNEILSSFKTLTDKELTSIPLEDFLSLLNISKPVFSKNATTFISYKNPELSSIPTTTLAPLSFKPACEASGGSWYEQKGKDLPQAGCACEYNTWREKHLEDIVERGCSCSNTCTGTESDFISYNTNSLSEIPKPSIAPSSSEKYLIFNDALSTCNFQAEKENICTSCQTDDDCGKFATYHDIGWVKTVTKSVCNAGKCYYRKVIYSEQ